MDWIGERLGSLLATLGFSRPKAFDDSFPSFAMKSAEWLVVACLVYRLTVPPFALAAAFTRLDEHGRSHGLVMAALVAWNMFLIHSVSRSASMGFLRTTAFAVVDLALAVLVNAWSAATLEAGRLSDAYYDVFWTYAIGTVALWTALRGVRTGGLICLAGGGLLIVMGLVNGGEPPVGRLLESSVSRFAWLASALPLPAVIIRLAGLGAGTGSAEARGIGRASERVRALRSIHDTVLQTLAQIAQQALIVSSGVRESARQRIHELASRQLRDLERVMRADDTARAGLVDGLLSLVREFRARGVAVDVTTTGMTSEPSAEKAENLLGATWESVNNAVKHAEVRAVSIRAEATGLGHRVVIRDDGTGFDTASARHGLGIPGSIHGRMAEVGGQATITSALGRGTTVVLEVGDSTSGKAAGPTRSASAAVVQPLDQATKTDVLTRKALGWFAIAALVYRLALSPLQVGSFLTNAVNADDLELAWFLLVCVAVFAFDLFLLVTLLFGRFAALFKSPVLLILDVALTAGLNLWGAALLPLGSGLRPGNEILWGYTLGLAAFWTGLRGARAGLSIVGVGAVLQFAMVWINQSPITGDAWFQLISRQGFLTTSFVISWLLTRLARTSARQAVEEGLEAGRATERAWLLRDVYRKAVDALADIAAMSAPGTVVTSAEITSIRGTALDLVDRLRASIEQGNDRERRRLEAELARVARFFRARGLRVETVFSQIQADPPEPVLRAVVEATETALMKVLSHAGVSHAVVRATSVRGRCEVIVRDHGSGYAGTASDMQERRSRTIRRLMVDVGGDAAVWSTPGWGTRVAIRWPREVHGA